VAGEGAAGGYRIAPAAPEHVAALPAIERAAATLFSREDVPAAVAEEATPIADLAAAQRIGRLWVALAPDGTPVGFAIVELVDGFPHVREIDVHPEHGGRGVGRALLRAVLDAARAEGYCAVTLTTFSHVPWNAPFYERMGFRALAADELTPGLAAKLSDEAARGLDPVRRVAMRCAV
jgi:GNAT superfamily N-acetyltransferase